MLPALATKHATTLPIKSVIVRFASQCAFETAGVIVLETLKLRRCR